MQEIEILKDYGLSDYQISCIRSKRIYYIEDFKKITLEEAKLIRSFGEKGIKQLLEILRKFDITILTKEEKNKRKVEIKLTKGETPLQGLLCNKEKLKNITLNRFYEENIYTIEDLLNYSNRLDEILPESTILEMRELLISIRYYISIEEANLETPIYKIKEFKNSVITKLIKKDILTLKDLLKTPIEKILTIRNISECTVKEIEKVLNIKGYKLHTEKEISEIKLGFLKEDNITALKDIISELTEKEFMLLYSNNIYTLKDLYFLETNDKKLLRIRVEALNELNKKGIRLPLIFTSYESKLITNIPYLIPSTIKKLSSVNINIENIEYFQEETLRSIYNLTTKEIENLNIIFQEMQSLREFEEDQITL